MTPQPKETDMGKYRDAVQRWNDEKDTPEDRKVMEQAERKVPEPVRGLVRLAAQVTDRRGKGDR